MPSAKRSIHLYLGRHEMAASGLWIYSKNVVRALLDAFDALQKAGEATPFLHVSFGGSEFLQAELVDLLSRYNVEVTLRRLPLIFGSRRLSMILDLLHPPYGAALVHGTANLLPFAFGAKRVLTLHDVLQAYSPLPADTLYVKLRRCFYGAVLRLQAVFAHVLVTDHDYGRAELESHICCRKKIRVIHPPLDRSYIEAPLPKETEPSKTLLGFASMDPRKNIDSLLHAFAAWTAHNDWKLKIVSVGENVVRHLKDLAASLGIETHAEFLEHVPQSDMPLLYQSVQALVFPSMGEGFGYPIYEALSQGVPVLCAKGTVFTDLYDRVSPALVECDSLGVDDLVQGLEKIAVLGLSSEKRALTAKAVRDTLSSERMARELLDLYRKVAPELFVTWC